MNGAVKYLEWIIYHVSKKYSLIMNDVRVLANSKAGHLRIRKLF